MAERETTKEQLLEELRDSETRFRSLAQSAIDAIICSDSHDRITFWNKAAEHLFGYAEEEILGNPVITIVPESFRQAHQEGVKKFLETGQKALIGKIGEVQALRKDGTEFPIELSLSTGTARGETFFTAIIRDITDRKQAERALQQRTQEARLRKQELESLVQTVAHDLKSPVLTIAGLVRVLQKNMNGLRSGERLEKVLDQLSASSETMECFLKDLLDGLAANSTEPDPAPTDLNEVVTEVLSRYKQIVNDTGIAVRLDTPRTLPKVYADERRLKQVLDNLLANAIRYMGNGSERRIRIRAVLDGDVVVTSTSDTGMGIPKEFLSRIFDRFFRVPNTGVEIGSGLGMFIVKRIIEAHGGRVWIESEEGRGTTVSFSLPRSDTP